MIDLHDHGLLPCRLQRWGFFALAPGAAEGDGIGLECMCSHGPARTEFLVPWSASGRQVQGRLFCVALGFRLVPILLALDFRLLTKRFQVLPKLISLALKKDLRPSKLGSQRAAQCVLKWFLIFEA